MKFIFVVIYLSYLSTELRCKLHDKELIEKFRIVQTKQGDNENFPFKGDKVKIHFIGFFIESKEVFQSTRTDKNPFEFLLGKGQVIPCWDELVTLMSLGQRIVFECPSDMSNNEKPIGFDIELIEIVRDKDL